MNLRIIGLWLCPLGFLGMLAALAVGNTDLIIVEGFLTVTGAVLSLHRRPTQHQCEAEE